MTDKEKGAIKKTLLTPCRNIGLKRKSIGSNQQNKLVEAVNLNSSVSESAVSEQKQDNTPKRLISSPFMCKQPLIKKFKSNIKALSVTKLDDNELILPTKSEELHMDMVLQSRSETLYNDSVSQFVQNELHKDSLALQHKLEELSENASIIDSDAEISKTKGNISKKLEEIKRLESDSLNVKQHDLETLHLLIKKWRTACQQALTELLTEYTNSGKTLSMSVVLNSLGIPPTLVHYSETEMDFYD